MFLRQNLELPRDTCSHVYYAGLVPDFPWGDLMVPLWDVRTNWRVLQASVHLDNCVLADLPLKSVRPVKCEHCYFEHMRRLTSKLNLGHNRIRDSCAGCVMEMVRTSLAGWLYSPPDGAHPPDWAPILPPESIEFSAFVYQGLLRWECQCLLEESFATMMEAEENFHASPHLIMLFILAYPGIRCSVVPNDQVADIRLEMVPSQSYSFMPHSSASSLFQSFQVPVEFSDVGDRISVDQVSGNKFSFSRPFAPQHIEVVVELIGDIDKYRIFMKLVAADGVREFYWADWIDAAMGFMKEVDDIVGDRNRPKVPEHVLNWRKRTPSKCDYYRSHPEIPHLPGDIRIWAGWPPYGIKVVQFQMNQWLQAVGLLHGNCEVILPEVSDLRGDLRREIINAEKGLSKILEWNRR